MARQAVCKIGYNHQDSGFNGNICAVLVAIHWWLASRWLEARGMPSRTLAGLGLACALALGVYATFLGTEGVAYGFLRRYGVTGFFG